MGKRRGTPGDQKENSGSSDEDQKMDEKNAPNLKKSKQRESRYSSSSSSSSRSSSNNDLSNSSAGKKQKRSKKKNRNTEGAEEIQEKRTRNLEKQSEETSQKVQEQRSKWDSPDRGNGGQRHNSHRNTKQRRHSRSYSRERERERETEKERHRDSDRDNPTRRDRSRREQRQRSPVQRQRARSNERKERPRRSPERRPERRSRSRSPRDRPNRDGRDFGRRKQQRRDNRSRGDDEHFEWGRKGDDKAPPDEEPVEKEKPNFGLSGALTEDTNKVNGVVVKYSEPVEARKPKRRWRLYPFKGETALPTLHIHRQSCFLVGRDRKVVDLAVDHPSCSKQHAALQYRLVPFEREDGSQGKRVRLYLIDLESANGTFLNNKKVDGRKYYELMEKDVIKFGFSSREYVLLHENSKEDQEDDDVHIKEERVDVPAEEVNA
ncbi:smad nuclear-interacting protein 1 [Drosophila pseudoobscura]|uniref:Smad nuclear-interacting protein 1 n=1 Tax=Drosophila pseudoobscura pseudoobscura TaxID=46245 RepID=A0A6I8UZ73_DROPS|nr:smad nuclear-interacting protein 1 [Drosophila pseudoobscura]